MLKYLHVENFALMDSISLEFNDGFTVLTGETGAGKSILIDAIGYVLGNKFNREFIRTGTHRLSVKAEFILDSTILDSTQMNSSTLNSTVLNPSVIDNIKNQLALDDISHKVLNDALKSTFEDNKLIIERANDTKGKAVAKINNVNVNIQDIKEIATFLLDIHGQHNSQKLLDPVNHIEYLDLFGDIEKSKEFLAYKKVYKTIEEKKSKLNELTSSNERDKIMEFLRFQIEDIKKGRPDVKEEEELEEKEKMLSNSQKIADALKSAMEAINEDVLSSLATGFRSLNSIEDVFNKAQSPAKIMEEAWYNLTEASRDLRDFTEDIYFDENELDEINGRLFTYSTLKKKYGSTTEEILENLKSMEERFNDLENAREIIEKLKMEIESLTKEGLEKGISLGELREKTSYELSKKINESLKDVGLKKANFQCTVLPQGVLGEKGTDLVRFMISTNTGEPMKPLEKIVSGGELSRIMLSLKTAFIDKDRIPTVIFDEIDTGISGRIAESVGEKMFNISKNTQVLCVTHLPQIASFSDRALIVEKVEDKGRTKSSVRYGSHEDKVMEIAKMLSGSKITKTMESNAKEMVENAEKVKNAR